MRKDGLLNLPQCIVVMGVAGAGKTTVGELLAQRFGGSFLDADSLHPPSNIAKMRAGVPLGDEDRKPWLDEIVRHAGAHEGPKPLVIACSALKQAYRDRLSEITRCFVYLRASREELQVRIAGRPDHYFPARLLESQFVALEEPVDAITLSAMLPVEQIIGSVAASFHTRL